MFFLLFGGYYYSIIILSKSMKAIFYTIKNRYVIKQPDWLLDALSFGKIFWNLHRCKLHCCHSYLIAFANQKASSDCVYIDIIFWRNDGERQTRSFDLAHTHTKTLREMSFFNLTMLGYNDPVRSNTQRPADAPQGCQRRLVSSKEFNELKKKHARDTRGSFFFYSVDLYL